MRKLVFFMAMALMAMVVGCRDAAKADSVGNANDPSEQTLQGGNDFTLRDAYNELAKMPKMRALAEDDSVPLYVDSASVDSMLSVLATGLSREEVYDNGREMFGILDRVGLQKMIVGGSNQYMAGFAYAEPLRDGRYGLLIAAACGEYGQIVVNYGITDKATVDAIQQSKLTLDMKEVVVSLKKNVNLINITIGGE
ncbi:MAG: hypothetical protein NC102_01040 [Clostridium sp.]|nr:hypothetical protein [Clostridium sp.]